MWCVHCHVFWNWHTRRVIPRGNGATAPHNPDHREFIANGRQHAPREVDDVPCGGIPEPESMHTALLREFNRILSVHPSTEFVVSAFSAVYRAQRLRHEYPLRWEEGAANAQLRMQALLGEVTDDLFATRLERDDRNRHYKRDIGLVLEAFVLSATDVLQRFVAGVQDVSTTHVDLEALRAHIDETFVAIGRAHERTSVPRLSSTWTWRLPYDRSSETTGNGRRRGTLHRVQVL